MAIDDGPRKLPGAGKAHEKGEPSPASKTKAKVKKANNPKAWTHSRAAQVQSVTVIASKTAAS